MRRWLNLPSSARIRPDSWRRLRQSSANEGFRNIVLDLGDVQYVDSSGLSALLVGNRLCKESTGTFVLTGLNPHIQKLIKISQLEPILHIVASLNESVDYIMMEELDRDLKT